MTPSGRFRLAVFKMVSFCFQEVSLATMCQGLTFDPSWRIVALAGRGLPIRCACSIWISSSILSFSRMIFLTTSSVSSHVFSSSDSSTPIIFKLFRRD